MSSRIVWCLILGVLSTLVAMTAVAGGDLGSEPVTIGSRLEPFFDEGLLEKSNGVSIQLHSPTSAGKIFAFDRPWEGNVSWNLTTLKDGERYRLYYVGRTAPDYLNRALAKAGESVPEKHPNFLCVAESRDGIAWTKPMLGVYAFQGSKENNIVSASEEGPGVPFLDTNPATPPGERYKAAWAKKGADGVWGMSISVSDDGVRWRKWRDTPVFTSTLPNAFDSINLIFWSEHEQQYVCYFRFKALGVRSIVRTTSKDLIHWTDQVPIDFGSAPPEHLYTNAAAPYFRAPHVYVGFPKRFAPWRQYDEEMPSPGISEAVFMTTRDGLHWKRFMEAFIRPGRDRRNWVHRTTHVSSGMVQTADDEISLYVSRNYTYPSAYMERFVIRTDGFASLHGGYPGGECVTRPLVFKGGQLVLNYATSAVGSIRIEIQDLGGRPISGFTLEESPVLFGDEIAKPVRWGRPTGQTDRDPLRRLENSPVRLRFVLRDADLYSMQFR